MARATFCGSMVNVLLGTPPLPTLWLLPTWSIPERLREPKSFSAAHLKPRKYDELTRTHIFVPVAVETLGAWCQEGLNWLEEIGRRVSSVTGDQRETFFLFQRLSVAVQRGNAASIRD